MSAVQLTTFGDLVGRLIDYLGSNATSEARRDCIRAVLDAYSELSNDSRWAYYLQRGRIVTVASYNTGTVEYLHSGATFERQLTLTSGTWPSWAQYGQVVLGTNVCQVADRKSSTV